MKGYADRKDLPRFIAVFGCLLAAAILLGYVEMLIPIQIPIQGVKLGLANGAVLLMLYLFDAPSAWLLSILRILLSGFLFSSLMTILYSLAGGIFSLLVMTLLKKLRIFGIPGVSMAGAVAHNIGQLAVAALVLRSVESLLFYLPVLLVSGVVTGLVIGVIVRELLPKLTFLNNGGYQL